MFIPSFLQPQNTSVVETLIQNVESQLNNPSVRFSVDEKLAEKAREVFNDNLRKNLLVSKISRTVGIIGKISLWTSMGGILFQMIRGVTIGTVSETLNSALLSISPYLIVAAAVGFVFVKIFHLTRNREGYQLQKALDANTSADMIRQLSLGANIHQRVTTELKNSALADHFFYSNETQHFFVDCKLVSLNSYLLRKNQLEATMYLLMISNDRKQFATECLRQSNPNTAQLFIDQGADKDLAMHKFCSDHQLDLIKILVQNGVKLDETFLGFSPLETLIPIDLKKPDGQVMTKADVVKVLEALAVAPAVYNLPTAAELFTALNNAGVAVRLKNAEVIHQCLQRTN